MFDLLKVFRKDTKKPHQKLISQNLPIEEEIQEKFKTAFFQVYTESIDAVRLAKEESDQEALEIISDFEQKFPNFNGLVELFQLEPVFLRWGTFRDGSEITRVLSQLPKFDEKLTKLNNLKDADVALTVVGVEETKRMWRVEEIKKEGYTLDCFEGITFLFKNRLSSSSDIYLELGKIKGTFEYSATTYGYLTRPSAVTEFFRTNEKGEQYLYTAFFNNKKISEPTDLVVKIDPPTKQEFLIIEKVVLAYERRLIRMGFSPSNLVEEGSMNSASFNRLMDNNFGIESKRRPCLIWPNDETGVRMADFEDIVEILYLTNKLLSDPKLSPFFNQ